MNWKLFFLILTPTLVFFAAGLLFAMAGLKVLALIVIGLAYACICLSMLWAPKVMNWLGWDY